MPRAVQDAIQRLKVENQRLLHFPPLPGTNPMKAPPRQRACAVKTLSLTLIYGNLFRKGSTPEVRNWEWKWTTTVLCTYVCFDCHEPIVWICLCTMQQMYNNTICSLVCILLTSCVHCQRLCGGQFYLLCRRCAGECTLCNPVVLRHLQTSSLPGVCIDTLCSDLRFRLFNNFRTPCMLITKPQWW